MLSRKVAGVRNRAVESEAVSEGDEAKQLEEIGAAYFAMRWFLKEELRL